MAERLGRAGIPAPLLLMLSNGGLTHVEPRPSARPCRCWSRGRRRVPSPPPSSATRTAAARAGLRHGGHHGQALSLVDGGQAARRLQLRGRAAKALRRGQRPADPHLDHRADRDRRRRRQHRPRRRDRPAQGRAAQRRLRAGARRLRARRHRGHRHRRRLRAGLSQPRLFRRRHHGIDSGPRRAAMRPRGRARGALARGGGVGHPRHRQREHGRAPRACTLPSAGKDPRALRAARHRRRGAGARLLRRQEAGPCAG